MVLSPLTSAAIFLVVTIDSVGEDTVRDLLSDVASLERAVVFRAQPDGRSTCTTSTRGKDSPPRPRSR
ncbi:Dyp-type peroxidase domain-containing protein [Streptomyces mutabilis]|uniref:Dyp-type peroxidase domain-containing protein n=1 Tax=Streptomyces mutabilis TaxID=67332 RepID=UPI0036BD4D12